MSEEHPHALGHGNTVAAWTAVAIMLVGCVISAVSIWFAAIPGFWVGVGVVVLGAIVGKVLQVMGFGKAKVSA